VSAAHELPVLVTVDEAAESLSLHPDQVRRLVRRGELVGARGDIGAAGPRRARTMTRTPGDAAPAG